MPLQKLQPRVARCQCGAWINYSLFQVYFGFMVLRCVVWTIFIRNMGPKQTKKLIHRYSIILDKWEHMPVVEDIHAGHTHTHSIPDPLAGFSCQAFSMKPKATGAEAFGHLSDTYLVVSTSLDEIGCTVSKTKSPVCVLMKWLNQIKRICEIHKGTRRNLYAN